jgi:hypothetical protein
MAEHAAVQDQTRFHQTGSKTHQLVPDTMFVLVTEIPGDLTYTLEFPYVRKLWKEMFSENRAELCLARLSSGEPVVINYDERKAYVRENPKISPKKIIYGAMKLVAEEGLDVDIPDFYGREEYTSSGGEWPW